MVESIDKSVLQQLVSLSTFSIVLPEKYIKPEDVDDIDIEIFLEEYCIKIKDEDSWIVETSIPILDKRIQNIFKDPYSVSARWYFKNIVDDYFTVGLRGNTKVSDLKTFDNLFNDDNKTYIFQYLNETYILHANNISFNIANILDTTFLLDTWFCDNDYKTIVNQILEKLYQKYGKILSEEL